MIHNYDELCYLAHCARSVAATMIEGLMNEEESLLLKLQKDWGEFAEAAKLIHEDIEKLAEAIKARRELMDSVTIALGKKAE